MVKHLFISSFDLLMHTQHKNKTVHAPIFCWPYISYLCLSEFLQTGLGPLSVLV